MIKTLDHLAIAAGDLEPAVAAYETLLGHAAIREAPRGGAERAWFHLPNIALELIAPAGDGPAGERVRARLAEAGEGLWLMAFAAEDLAAAGRAPRGQAVRGLEPDPPAGGRGAVGLQDQAALRLFGGPPRTAGARQRGAQLDAREIAAPAPGPQIVYQ